MVKLFRHRQPKGADTAKPHLSPPRHIPTLPIATVWLCAKLVRCTPTCGRNSAWQRNVGRSRDQDSGDLEADLMQWF